MDHKILLKEDGVDQNVIKIKPPIIFTLDHAKKLLTAIDSVLTEIESCSDRLSVAE